MADKKLKVYCETSFWSYLNGHPTPLQHIAVKQAATLQWWQEIAPNCDVYVSQHVAIEAADGDSEFVERRAEGVSKALKLDGMTGEIRELAHRLLDAHAIPDTEPTDACTLPRRRFMAWMSC